MEQDFAARLKQYRRAKNLTQQELADLLGVSNKTVSRWESDGGYPDVPLLVPLARALGVSTDDLLDGEKPIRTLTRTDWQSLLSFAFAIGGGLLFFLLGVFVPLPVCYALYLGCLAYGVYLQRYYCYRSKWFWAACGGMNLCVNLTVVLAMLLLLLGLSMGVKLRAEDWRLFFSTALTWLTAVGVVLAAGATALTLCLARVWCKTGRFRLAGQLRTLRLARPALPALLPAAGALVLTGFWGGFAVDALPAVCYRHQNALYLCLLLVLLSVCALACRKRGRRVGLLSAGLMAGGGALLPQLAVPFAWSPYSQQVVAASPALAEAYLPFGRLGPALAAAGVALCALCALVACLRQSEE